MQFLHPGEAEKYGIKIWNWSPSKKFEPTTPSKKEPPKYMCKNGTHWEQVPPYFEKCWDGSKPWDGIVREESREESSRWWTFIPAGLGRWWTFIPAGLAGLFTLGFIAIARRSHQ
jgi:hypothetical protein